VIPNSELLLRFMRSDIQTLRSPFTINGDDRRMNVGMAVSPEVLSIQRIKLRIAATSESRRRSSDYRYPWDLNPSVTDCPS
jgi:hypothetical protein